MIKKLLHVMSSVCLIPSVAWTQIVANPNAPKTQQPTIFPAANGVTQVNIQTPSAAGVSRNSYSQFDVPRKGIVLNNSNADVQTQQAGWVQANPWLTTGTAKVILNEVFSPNPSQFNGYIEVAGQRVDVIVANPSGISVNGGGFINASKGILTTGTPVFNNNGGIDSYRVQGGNVSIDGAGLDMRTTDYAAILSRAVQVNAGIWANELKVITGANQVDATSLNNNTTPTVTPLAVSGTAPAFALDVAAIGGMYANKIYLIGTEAGLGVRNAGTLSASDALVLSNNGWLSNTGAVQAQGDVQIATQGDVSNAGNLYAGANQSVTVTGNINNTVSGVISSAGDTQINTSADLTNRGAINGGNTYIASANVTNIGTGRIYGDHIAVATGTLTNDAETIAGVKTAATLAARQRLDIGAKTINNTNDALIYSDGDLFIGGGVDKNHQAQGRAVSVINNGSTIEAAKNMSITAEEIQNLNRDLAYKVVTLENFVNSPGATNDSEYVTNVGVIVGDPSLILHDAVSYPVKARATTFFGVLWTNGTRLFVLPADSPYNTAKYKELYKTDPTIRAAMDAQAIDVSAWRDYTTDKQILVATVSNPGKLTSGQNMRLDASRKLLNDMSQVVAGGAIDIVGVDVENRQRTEAVTDKRHGSEFLWQTQDEGCGSSGGCHWVVTAYWGGPNYSQSINTTYTLSLASTKQNQSVTSAGLKAANNSLFRQPTNPSAGYLIETDPIFASKQKWLGSDYLFTALRLDPASTQKRLGDGFYEQKLIREQVANLTGKRFLGDYTSDEQQYQALMDNAATVAKSFNLRPGIALTEAQVAQLTSDIVWMVSQTVTFPDGTVTQALVPQIYVRPRAGDVTADGALISGTQVNMQLSGDLNNQGTIAGRKVVNLAANNIDNTHRIVSDSVNLNASQDITVNGGSVEAQSSISAHAARDVNVQSTTYGGVSADGRNSLQGIERMAGLYVSGAAGQLNVKAGRDINLTAATVSNLGSGETTLEAANTIAMKTLTESRSVAIGSVEDHQFVKADQSKEIGSNVLGGGNVTFKAADIQIRAATLEAGTNSAAQSGTLNLQAKNNVTIESGLATQNFLSMEKQSSHGGVLGSDKETITTRVNNSTTAQASNLGGKDVLISTGQDLTIKGSQVVGDQSVSLNAGNALVVEAAQNTHTQGFSQQTIEKGFLSGGGLGISYGERKQSLDTQTTTTTAAASTIGSINGNVSIKAGTQYKQVGSDVLAPSGDITISAKTVDIQEARETSKQSTEQKFEQSGFSLSVTSTVLSTLENAQNQIKATEQTKNSRMQALGTASAAANTKMALDALKAGQGDENGMVKTGNTNPDGTPEMAQGNFADKAGGIQISLSYGQSSSQSNSSAVSDTARGSTINAGGVVNIQASGAGADSNLVVQGSEIKGKVINLEAENKIDLLAAVNTTVQNSTNSNASASVGASAGLGNGAGGIGLTGSISKGNGSGNGSETTYTNTHVTGTDAVNIKSGADTTLKGATAEGKQVTVTVGGNLNIESLQDTATYAERNQQTGVSGMVGAGTSGNIQIAKSNINSNYASVTEQSGIKAGDGGFTVNVQGNTDLKGGAIISTQAAVDQNKNTFSTGGTLTTSDIQNKASFDANSVSAGVAVGGTPMPGQGLSAGMSGAGMGKDSGSASSTTTAGISGIAGDTGKRTGDRAQGIAKIFDADKVRQEIQAQTQITQEFAKQASAAIASYSDQQKQTLQDQIKKASDVDKPALKQQLDQVLLEEKVLNILVGAVTGFGETMVTKESLKAAAEQMREAMIADSKIFKGVVDSTGKELSNASGTSEGVNRDGKKVGGTRVDLDLLCGPSNARCKTNSDGSLLLNDKGQVQFDAKDANNNPISLDEFLKTPEGQKMSGPTGGVQGAVGTLFGEPYTKGSWQDKLIEAFAGTHDMIGGKLSGLYDDQGNIKQGMSQAEINAYKVVSGVAILPSAPFAAAQGLPPEVWKAFAVLLGAAK